MQLNDRKVIESKHAIESEEKVTQDDGLHSYISTMLAMFNEAEEIYEIGSISTDITKFKLQEEKIHRSLKMDSLGKLTGGIAHDYNNILGVVSGYAELLISELNDIKLKSYAEKISTTSDRLQTSPKITFILKKKLTNSLPLNLKKRHDKLAFRLEVVLKEMKDSGEIAAIRSAYVDELNRGIIRE